MVVLSYPCGYLFDVFIRRNKSIKIIFAVGGCICGAGLICGSIGRALGGVIFAAFVTGVGLGLCGTAASSCVQPWFDKRRGVATGLAMSGSGVGNFVYAVVVQVSANRGAFA